MSSPAERTFPALGIALASRRMGYILLAENRFVIDYGVFEFSAQDRQAPLAKAEQLVVRHGAQIVYLQDVSERDCRLGAVGRDHVKKISASLQERKLIIRSVTKRAIWSSFGFTRPVPKHRLAEIVAQKIPDLAYRVPEPRKPWECEHRDMCLFIAAAMIR